MNLESATSRQRRIGRAGAFFCILFIVSGLDGLVAVFRTPPGEFRTVPGEVISVNGPCSSDIKDVSELTYESSSDGIGLRFEAMQAGFWLGGTLWRGLLVLNRELAPGEYRVTVRPKNIPGDKPFSIFSIKVFPNIETLHRASNSFVQRVLSLSPWLVSAIFMGLTGLAFATVYGISEKRDGLMASEGLAEIYRVAKGEEAIEVAFGLGSAHGVHMGDSLILQNKRGEAEGQVYVVQSFDRDSVGTVDLKTTVNPGYLVRKKA
jgi:hypothetical protein